ncbi:MAG: hypothetical protein M1828_002216 [Chrysothrix sp. TS-e1954]|nr:MAG: hypothetical protein M1828_002216 [Chrysothrix sp. TS-e1954]
MEDTRDGAYGKQSSDTSFRKTWDKTVYAAKAAERDIKVKEEGKARYEATLAGRKYHKRASTPPDASATEARRQRLDVSAQVGKQTLVPLSSAVGKRGKGAGFYCECCDLTFKDNLQLVEHYNSRQHLIAIGQTGEVKRATVEDVRSQLAWLARKKEEEKEEQVIDLSKRLEKRTKMDDKTRQEKRRMRNEKRRKTEDGRGNLKIEHQDDGVIR